MKKRIYVFAPCLLVLVSFFVAAEEVAEDKLPVRYLIPGSAPKDNQLVKILERGEKPILEPTKEWEINGPARNVTFAEGIIKFHNEWLLYYGAADKCIGLAKAPGE